MISQEQIAKLHAMALQKKADFPLTVHLIVDGEMVDGILYENGQFEQAGGEGEATTGGRGVDTQS